MDLEPYYPDRSKMPPEKLVEIDAWKWSRSLHEDMAVDSMIDVGTGEHGIFDVWYWDGRKLGFKIALDIFELPNDFGSLGWKHHHPGWHGILADARRLSSLFRPKNIDVIQVMETLEHMNREDGMKTLAECCRVARKLVLTSSCGIGHHLGESNREARTRNPFDAFRHLPLPEDYESLGFNWLYNAGGQMLAWKYL